MMLYSLDDRLLVRMPRYAFSGPGTMDLNTLISNDEFMEAVYLASPVLYSECMKYRDGHFNAKKDVARLAGSLAKYFIRMSSRCTPFGLFSGCAVTQFTERPTSIKTVQGGIGRHTRLDMHYVCALAHHLELHPELSGKLLYYSNNSIYSIGDDLRYVEYFHREGKLLHQISSVGISDYLQSTLAAAAGGATIQELAQRLTDETITIAEAQAFVEELIKAQLLVSEMEPVVTGKSFIDHVMDVLARISRESGGHAVADRVLGILRDVHGRLDAINQSSQPEVSAYKDIIDALAPLGVSCDENRIFQVDMTQRVSGGVNEGMKERLIGTVEVLNRLVPRRRNQHLDRFIQTFLDRYEQKEMPLLEVLDSEISIGYVQDSVANIAPLIDDIIIPENTGSQQYSWGALENLLNGKLQEMYRTGARSIEIKDTDLASFPSDWDELGPSLPVMFRIVDKAGDSIYVESAGGASGVNLLGRFAYADAAIGEMVNAIAAREQELDPDVVYAEIVHLPERRTGNILLRPAFRPYEIPYLAQSTLPREQQIDVSDLYVSVRNNRIILRSRRLGKVVIPRLGTAHNFANNALPVYRFLCDLQLQDKKGSLSFQWGGLQHQQRYLPRVVYKNSILHLASWSFFHGDIKDLLPLDEWPLAAALARFRETWKLPERVVLSDGDNDLLIDFGSVVMVRMWLETVKNRESFILREFIHDQDLVADSAGKGYVNQFIAVLVRNSSSYGQLTRKVTQEDRPDDPVREFSPGSEWMYYKLYCGVKSADKILQHTIGPLCEEVIGAGLADKWFFIRYYDPDFHIRLRLHIIDMSHMGEVVEKMNVWLEEMMRKKYIWKVQQDTYRREVERYGRNGIGLAETLFYYDSIALIQLLEQTSGDDRENLRWLWGLRAVDNLLTDFGLSLSQKYEMMDALRKAFWKEMHIDKFFRQQFDDKYRMHKKTIGTMLGATDEGRELFEPLLMILREKSVKVKEVAGAVFGLVNAGLLEVSLPDLLSSYIHMMINRISLSDPRKQEMVMYDFLARYYQSEMARNKQMVK